VPGDGATLAGDRAGTAGQPLEERANRSRGEKVVRIEEEYVRRLDERQAGIFTSPTFIRRGRRTTSTPGGSSGSGTVDALSTTIVLTETSWSARLARASSRKVGSRSQSGITTVR
jgi:hypothetical protein